MTPPPQRDQYALGIWSSMELSTSRSIGYALKIGSFAPKPPKDRRKYMARKKKTKPLKEIKERKIFALIFPLTNMVFVGKTSAKSLWKTYDHHFRERMSISPDSQKPISATRFRSHSIITTSPCSNSMHPVYTKSPNISIPTETNSFIYKPCPGACTGA